MTPSKRGIEASLDGKTGQLATFMQKKGVNSIKLAIECFRAIIVAFTVNSVINFLSKLLHVSYLFEYKKSLQSIQHFITAQSSQDGSHSQSLLSRLFVVYCGRENSGVAAAPRLRRRRQPFEKLSD